MACVRRGDIVVCAIPGDYGKPRPAVVVQSDLFNPTHASIVVCPITSHCVDAPLFRLPLTASKATGLGNDSQIMVDKITAIRADRIAKRIGRLESKQQAELNKAISLWLACNQSCL